MGVSGVVEIIERMANSNDNSGKGPAKPTPDAAPKKPTALLDLKATEVDIRDPNSDQKRRDEQAASAKPSSAGNSTSAGATAAAATIAGEAKAAESAAATAATSTAKPHATSTPTSASSTTASATSAPLATGTPTVGGTSSSGTKPTATAQPSTTAPRTGTGTGATAIPPVAASAPKAAAASGGLRGAATHLVAGLAGGLLAFLGAEALAPELGLGGAGPASTQLSAEVNKRLSNLEVIVTRPPSSDVSQKLTAAENRLAELERASRVVVELSQQHARLAAETKTLGERLQHGPTDTSAEGRIAKLEDALGTLSASATKDPQPGRIPQLAAISGRLADLEANLAAQVANLRKSVTQEVDSRLGQSNEAAQAARVGTQRLDRELAGVKTESVQLSQRLDGIKSQTDRADIVMRGLREEASTLKSEIGVVREDLTRELRQVARPTDVATALTPLTSKLSLLEQNVQGVVRNEDDRRANVERIVTALELGNLKRTVDRGAAFTTELAEVRRVAGPKLDLTVLERYRDKGVPALTELERDFRKLAFAIVEADAQPANAQWADRLLASAKSVVRVRKTDQGAEAQGAEAVVARMETSLKGGRLSDVVGEAGKLSKDAKAPALPWLEKVEARLAVDRAIAAIEQELKSSLGAASQTGKKG